MVALGFFCFPVSVATITLPPRGAGDNLVCLWMECKFTVDLSQKNPSKRSRERS